MTIKTLRKGYENLSMLQRLSLLDNAISRDDESEAEAITAASPRKIFSQTDYCNLFADITRIRLCNLIIRLGHLMMFDQLTHYALDKIDKKSSFHEQERLANDLRLSAFLYVRATDSWKSVNDQLGLRTNFDEEIGELLFSTELLQSKEAAMRQLAFTEAEARAYLLKRTGSDNMKTIDDEIAGYREYLELNGR
jgi:hypothetical protein